eukprot:scaffold7052_cov254-Pinguiococcus_pyrenoidosus.AAC.67
MIHVQRGVGPHGRLAEAVVAIHMCRGGVVGRWYVGTGDLLGSDEVGRLDRRRRQKDVGASRGAEAGVCVLASLMWAVDAEVVALAWWAGAGDGDTRRDALVQVVKQRAKHVGRRHGRESPKRVEGGPERLLDLRRHRKQIHDAEVAVLRRNVRRHDLRDQHLDAEAADGEVVGRPRLPGEGGEAQYLRRRILLSRDSKDAGLRRECLDLRQSIDHGVPCCTGVVALEPRGAGAGAHVHVRRFYHIVVTSGLCEAHWPGRRQLVLSRLEELLRHGRRLGDHVREWRVGFVSKQHRLDTAELGKGRAGDGGHWVRVVDLLAEASGGAEVGQRVSKAQDLAGLDLLLAA